MAAFSVAANGIAFASRGVSAALSVANINS